jgi:polysaccharide export outer membrane protein
MTPRTSVKMGLSRKLFLAAAGAAILAVPVVFGMATAVQAGVPQGAVPAVSPPARPVTKAGPPAPARVVTRQPPAASQVKANPPAESAPSVPPVRDTYRLRPGDELDIFVWKQPEISRRSVVRPDGNIGVPLVGDLPAEGLTPMDLQDAIRNRLKIYVETPSVTVIVTTPRNPRVFIQGSVAQAGAYPLDGRMTLLQLLASAGGLTPFAKSDQIYVFRNEEGTNRRYVFNYRSFLTGGDLTQNIVLQEGDIVIVP